MKEEIIDSFNKIALLDDKLDHNQHYERILLKEVTHSDGNALDIGCGTNLETALPKIERLLKQNGKLLVLDLYERKGIVDRILDCIAVPANYVMIP